MGVGELARIAAERVAPRVPATSGLIGSVRAGAHRFTPGAARLADGQATPLSEKAMTVAWRRLRLPSSASVRRAAGQESAERRAGRFEPDLRQSPLDPGGRDDEAFAFVTIRRARIHELANALEEVEVLLGRLGDRRPAVFLDYDGTLTPIVDRPEDAVISDSMRHALRALARRCSVCVVSGRDRPVVQELMGMDDLIVAGSHGFDIWSPRRRGDSAARWPKAPRS